MDIRMVNPHGLPPDQALELARNATDINHANVCAYVDMVLSPTGEFVDRHETALESIYHPVVAAGTKAVKSNERAISKVLTTLQDTAISQVASNHGQLNNVRDSLQGRQNGSNRRGTNQTDRSNPNGTQDRSHLSTTNIAIPGFGGTGTSPTVNGSGEVVGSSGDTAGTGTNPSTDSTPGPVGVNTGIDTRPIPRPQPIEPLPPITRMPAFKDAFVTGPGGIVDIVPRPPVPPCLPPHGIQFVFDGIQWLGIDANGNTQPATNYCPKPDPFPCGTVAPPIPTPVTPPPPCPPPALPCPDGYGWVWNGEAAAFQCQPTGTGPGTGLIDEKCKKLASQVAFNLAVTCEELPPFVKKDLEDCGFKLCAVDKLKVVKGYRPIPSEWDDLTLRIALSLAGTIF